MLEGDNVFWDLLLMFVLSESQLTCAIITRVISNMYLYSVVFVITYLHVMDDYSLAVVACSVYMYFFLILCCIVMKLFYNEGR
jgi:hypothetical protein